MKVLGINFHKHKWVYNWDCYYRKCAICGKDEIWGYGDFGGF